MTPLERRVLDLVDVDDVVAMTSALVRARGQNPPGEERATAETLRDLCAERGLDVHWDEAAPGRPNVSAVLPGGDGPGLLLLGHTDVVPVGSGWTEDAFGGIVRDGRVFGRGTSDMKGGLAACVGAMRALRAAGVRLSGPVELAATVDEEENGLGIHHYLTRDRSSFAGCVVAEPTSLQTIVAARGAANLEVTVAGVAAHAGDPSQGRNAIYGAAAVIADLEQWHGSLAAARHPLVGPATVNVGLVHGGVAASTVPAEARVVLDRRLLPGEEGPRVLDDLRSRVAALDLDSRGLRVSTSLDMWMPGFETPPDAALVAAVERALARAGGPGLGLGGWTAACDGGFVVRDAGVPCVVLGPGSVADQAHRPDESVGIDELAVAIRAYALTALDLLT